MGQSRQPQDQNGSQLSLGRRQPRHPGGIQRPNDPSLSGPVPRLSTFARTRRRALTPHSTTRSRHPSESWDPFRVCGCACPMSCGRHGPIKANAGSNWVPAFAGTTAAASSRRHSTAQMAIRHPGERRDPTSFARTGRQAPTPHATTRSRHPSACWDPFCVCVCACLMGTNTGLARLRGAPASHHRAGGFPPSRERRKPRGSVGR